MTAPTLAFTVPEKLGVNATFLKFKKIIKRILIFFLKGDRYIGVIVYLQPFSNKMNSSLIERRNRKEIPKNLWIQL